MASAEATSTLWELHRWLMEEWSDWISVSTEEELVEYVRARLAPWLYSLRAHADPML